VILLALSTLVGRAGAVACVCARNVALPSAGVQRAWAGVFVLDYGAKLEADPDAWRGFGFVDRHGDSMAGMYMPPMLVHTASLGATLGLPANFSVSTTLPYMYKDLLGESEMPGDTDLSSLNDVDVTGHWARASKARSKAFVALSAGPTFPTGTVVPNSPVRSGLGVVGAAGSVSSGARVSPRWSVAGKVSGATGFGPDATGYTVAPNASLVVGAQWSPRENGRLSLAALGMERWSGQDREDALVYENSGYLVTDLALAGTYTFWMEGVRSATFNLRLQAPLYQVVGDPMYAENFGASTGVAFVAF
jgi:hypothetical protein